MGQECSRKIEVILFSLVGVARVDCYSASQHITQTRCQMTTTKSQFVTLMDSHTTSLSLTLSLSLTHTHTQNLLVHTSTHSTLLTHTRKVKYCKSLADLSKMKIENIIRSFEETEVRKRMIERGRE